MGGGLKAIKLLIEIVKVETCNAFTFRDRGILRLKCTHFRFLPIFDQGKIARKAQPATAQREVRGAAMLRRTWRTGSTQPPRRAYRGAQRGQAHRRLNPLAEEDSIVESFGPTVLRFWAVAA